ncbi:pre-rRNA-processing endonuclease, putative [Candida dubliniensis CD36]|uniref:20S-pre-rRNA D-site endonuclease NOB1 n=1 Tax=Candida dubliniensis (strain CD36 / ATCC MYA-646 / CBS 7987 / NCPF 3949 / NRRL Y-17841) TaxID=573826 RepID=B9WDW9_CANDC|nr:pre-rRNA-processing endonuclease, putative [Candida dubliniensis CD36]CAX42877.1 pre-rRNA-processing endonuclease, putative [Candida dubliniensis CD36]
MSDTKNIESLILDAGPLITQPATTLQQYAVAYYTTPGVHSELKDEYSRQQLAIWGDSLKIKQPKQEYIDRVVKFAKLTGDYSVLSVNDLHIIALAYELECLNNGEENLRSFPGEVLKSQQVENENGTSKLSSIIGDDDGFVVATKRRGGRRQREKAELRKKGLLPTFSPKPKGDPETEEPDELSNVRASNETSETDSGKESDVQEQKKQEEPAPGSKTAEVDEITEEYNEDDDDGEWITPENLQEEILKDKNEQVQESNTTGPLIKVALATGDFACQNVAMQIGIKLLNAMSGKQITRVRNYMYRCHACFRLTPMSKDGRPKHFCPKCGGNTLLRCAVSIDNETGKITPHLKQNFQWIRRGERYSLPSPLSKNQKKLQGNGGYQHNKENRHKSLQTPLILNEDQKEYQQALKNDEWERKQQEKMLQDWIGGGSADNFVSPFGDTVRNSGVKVGRGRYANSSKKKRK